MVPCRLSIRSARQCAGVMSQGARVSADTSRSRRATAQNASASVSSLAGSRCVPWSPVTGIPYQLLVLYPHIEVPSV